MATADECGRTPCRPDFIIMRASGELEEATALRDFVKPRMGAGRASQKAAAAANICFERPGIAAGGEGESGVAVPVVWRLDAGEAPSKALNHAGNPPNPTR